MHEYYFHIVDYAHRINCYPNDKTREEIKRLIVNFQSTDTALLLLNNCMRLSFNL